MWQRHSVPTYLIAAIIAGTGVAFPCAAHGQLDPGDRVMVVTGSWQGEGILQELRPAHLLLLPDPGHDGGVLHIPLVEIRELRVARGVRPSGGLGRHVLLGALGTGLVGAAIGARTEYGAEAALASGVIMALPGLLLGAVVWALRAQPEIRWESVDLPVISPALTPPTGDCGAMGAGNAVGPLPPLQSGFAPGNPVLRSLLGSS